MKLQPTEFGHLVDLAGATAFFGNRSASEQVAKSMFGETSFCFLKQTHSNLVVEASPSQHPPLQADAHWTRKKDLAIGVYTADCIPCLMYSPSQKLVAAVHAGWRGVASRIIPATLTALAKQGAALSDLRVLIGPHIKTASFEVGLEVAQTLSQSSHSGEGFVHAHPDPSKRFVDLFQIALSQFQEFQIRPENILSVPIDTFATDTYASYRREKGTGARQISFIFLK